MNFEGATGIYFFADTILMGYIQFLHNSVYYQLCPVRNLQHI